MKKRLLPFMLLVFLANLGFGGTYTLKVTVNDSANVCYAAGSFNNWNPSANAMNKVSDSPKVFTLDIEVADEDTTSSEYQYLSGPDWKYLQRVPSANFKLTDLTEDGDVVTSFEAYYNTNQEKDITISVLVPVNVFQVYLTGSFNSWNSVSDRMIQIDSTVNGKEFELTIHTLDTTTLEYKFLAGPGWPYEQTAGNYKYMVDGAAVACDEFKAIFDPSKVGDITVNIISVPANTLEVWILGSYNGWSLDNAIQATDNGDGTYTGVIPMVETVEFKIWCHNDWPYEEAKDSLGNQLDANRTATFVDDPEVDVTVAYWIKLYNPDLKNIKVTVPDTVTVCYVAGDFNGWNTTGTPMTLVSQGPKVFAVDVQISDEDTTNSTYRILAGPAWKYEMVQAENFRISQLTEAGEVVDTFKAVYNVGMAKDVTIDVLVPVGVFRCFLTGSFNNWDPMSHEMTFVDSTANGKEFMLTIFALDTTSLEFKFLAGPGWAYEQTDATNYIYMTDGGTVVCDEFKNIFDPSKVGDITINITVPEGTPAVWIIGSFNNWALETAIQATLNEDGTYTAIIPMVADIEYKCWNYPDWIYEEAKDAEGNGLDENRTASFETGPVFDITVLYWKNVYGATGVKDPISQAYRMYTIHGTIVVEGVTSTVTIFDLNGRLIQNTRANGTFVSRELRPGLYIIRVDNMAQKIVVGY